MWQAGARIRRAERLLNVKQRGALLSMTGAYATGLTDGFGGANCSWIWKSNGMPY